MRAFLLTRAAPRARGPAGALARSIAHTPPEGGGFAARRTASAGVELRLVGVSTCSRLWV
jgi:hypothetical protein